MLLFVTVENKRCLNGSQIGQIQKKLYCWRSTRRKRKVILKAKFSSSITSGGKNRAWQEIANIVNAGNSVKRYIKEIHKNGTIYVLPQKLRFLSTLEFIIHKLPLRRGNYRGLFRGGTNISYPLKF
jgi:hypothetical protein